jgi:hypothetical protein
MILSATAPDPYSLAAIGTLLAGLGLSATAGLRAYIPLLAVGLAASANIIPLQSSFQDLASAPVLIILAVLTIVEFIIDKIPLVDHVSDAVHTIIRPVSGGIIMAGTANSLSTLSPWVAAILGALLALVFHGAKAATRPAVSATTVGVGNPIVSLVEDIVVLAAVLLLIFAPIVGVILLVLLAVVFVRLVGRILRRFRGGRGATGAGGSGRAGGRAKVVPASAAMVDAMPNTPSGKRGRKNRRGAPGQVALPAPLGLPVAVPPLPRPLVVPAVPVGMPVAAPGPAQAQPQPQPTVPPSPDAPTDPATYQPQYVPPLPVANPIFGGGLPGVIVPPGQTQPYPQPSPNQQPGNLYPPDATTLPGNTP